MAACQAQEMELRIFDIPESQKMGSAVPHTSEIMCMVPAAHDTPPYFFPLFLTTSSRGSYKFSGKPRSIPGPMTSFLEWWKGHVLQIVLGYSRSLAPPPLSWRRLQLPHNKPHACC